MMKNLVISTGAGISAESGMSTYRDAGGLWDKYPVMQVASAEGFAADLLQSLPSRGAWIEMAACASAIGLQSVAPLAGSVD